MNRPWQAAGKQTGIQQTGIKQTGIQVPLMLIILSFLPASDATEGQKQTLGSTPRPPPPLSETGGVTEGERGAL